MNGTHIQRIHRLNTDTLPIPTFSSYIPSALEPLNMNLLRKRQRLVIIRNHARSLGVSARQRHPIVDIQLVRPPSTRRSHHLGGRHGVALRVHLAFGPNAAALDLGARGARGPRVAREEVRREEGARDALLEKCEAVVRRVNDGEGEARGVLEDDVQLAVLGAVHDGGAGADVGLEAVEADGEDLGGVSWGYVGSKVGGGRDGVTYGSVRVHGRGGGALGAAIAGVGHGLDLDLLWRGLGGQSQGGKDEEAGEELHGSGIVL